MALVFNGGILRRFQDRGAYAAAAKGLRNPQYMNRKPAKSELADKAANHLAINIADVNVKGAPGMVSEVRSIEFL